MARKQVDITRAINRRPDEIRRLVELSSELRDLDREIGKVTRRGEGATEHPDLADRAKAAREEEWLLIGDGINPWTRLGVL